MAKSKAKGSKSASGAKASTRTAGTAVRTPKAAGGKPARTAADVIAELNGSKFSPWFCIVAFFVPFLLTMIGYIGFDVYPFGDRSVLTLDLNGQYIYYFEAIRDAFRGDGSLFYNWSRNLSGGFMGVIGYYLASPFTAIVVLMPRKLILEAIMLMQMCKVGAAGLTFCIYAQRSKHVAPLPSVIFSTMYAMMSYVMIQLINPMWVDGPVFLPLIILGVEYLIDDGRKINYIIPLALMFIANFYIGYMIAIFVAIYFVFYLFFCSKRKFNGLKDYAKTGGVMFISTIVVLMCSAIMILPVYSALSLGKFDFSEPVFDWKKRLFEWPELIATLMPDQYYSVNVDEGTRLYGRPEIYCGVLSVVLLPLFFINKKIKINHKLGYGAMLLVMFESMYIKPINMRWHGGQDPNWLPYRYSFLVSFLLVAMAAEVFSHLDGYKLSVPAVGGTFGGMTFLAVWFTSVMHSYNYNESKYQYVAELPYKAEMNYGDKRWNEIWLGTVVFAVILALIYSLCIYFYSNAKKKQTKQLIIVGMAAVVFFEAGYNGYDTFRKIYKEVGNSDRKSYTEIITGRKVVEDLEAMDPGFYRAEKTYSRMPNDNIGIGLKGLTHSSSVMNTRAINLLTSLGYFTQSFESKYEGNNPVADSLLGIKYVIDDPQRVATKKLLDDSYQKLDVGSSYIKARDQRVLVEEDHPVDFYLNPNALSIGYAASPQALEVLIGDDPFDGLNRYLSALIGELDTETSTGNEYYVPCDTKLTFDPEQISFHQYPYKDSNGKEIIHACYESKPTSTDAHVNLDTTVPDDGNLYLHINSNVKKQVNVWVGIKGEDGKYRGTNKETYDEYGQYFDTNSAITMRLGPFKAGDEVEVRLTIPPSNGNSYTGAGEYLMAVEKELGTAYDENGNVITDMNGDPAAVTIGDFQLYYLDADKFAEDISKLKDHQWEIDTDKSNDRYLEGKVTIGEDEIFVTSIPYEEGWTIKVDGKKIDNLIVEEKDEETGKPVLRNHGDENGNITEDGEVIVVGSLIGIKLPPGEHTISMKYTPPGFNIGIVTLILGIVCIVMFYIYDRKHNPVLKARRQAKEMKKQGIVPEEVIPAEEAPKKKTVQIIKSKGEITAETSEAAKQKEKEAQEEAEKLKNQNEALLNKGKAYAEHAAEQAEEEAEKTADETAEKVKEQAKSSVNSNNKGKNNNNKNNNNKNNSRSNSGKKKKKKK